MCRRGCVPGVDGGEDAQRREVGRHSRHDLTVAGTAKENDLILTSGEGFGVRLFQLDLEVEEPRQHVELREPGRIATGLCGAAGVINGIEASTETGENGLAGVFIAHRRTRTRSG